MPGIVVTGAHVDGENNVDWAAFLLGDGGGTALFVALAHAPVKDVLAGVVARVLFCRVTSNQDIKMLTCPITCCGRSPARARPISPVIRLKVFIW